MARQSGNSSTAARIRAKSMLSPANVPSKSKTIAFQVSGSIFKAAYFLILPERRHGPRCPLRGGKINESASRLELPDFLVPDSRRGEQAGDNGLLLFPFKQELGKSRYSVPVGRREYHEQQDAVHIVIFHCRLDDARNRLGVVPGRPHIHRVRTQGKGRKQLVDQ